MRRASHFPRSVDTAGTVGRVLLFPVRADPHGQFELFSGPTEPDHFSASQLIIDFTLLQMRIARMATYLSRDERARLIGDYHAVLNLVEQCEEVVAARHAREAQSLIARTA